MEQIIDDNIIRRYNAMYPALIEFFKRYAESVNLCSRKDLQLMIYYLEGKTKEELASLTGYKPDEVQTVLRHVRDNMLSGVKSARSETIEEQYHSTSCLSNNSSSNVQQKAATKTKIEERIIPYNPKAHSQKNSDHKSHSKGNPRDSKTKKSAKYQNFIEQVNAKVDLQNYTGIALNEGSMVMINGRLVSKELLENND